MKVPLKDKVALGLGLAFVLTNPFFNQYIVDGLERGLIYVSREFGVYTTLVAAAYIVGYMLYNAWAGREQVNIPKKTARTQKAGKLIAT